MEIDSLGTLQRLEGLIRQIIERYKIEHVLLGLRMAVGEFEPFVIGGATLFALRFCAAGRRRPNITVIEKEALTQWLQLVSTYLLADPIGYDQILQREYKNANPIFTVLRIVGSQMPYHVSLFGQHAQPLLLYHEIPKRLSMEAGASKFSFEAAFKELYGNSTREFINIGFTCFAAAQSNTGFTRGYFSKAREQGIKLPNEKKLLDALDRLAADPTQLRNLHRRYRSSDPRFAMYDFNPLFLRPLVRPWRQKKRVSIEEDRMVAPIPNLVVLKNSVGIFYEMFNRYGIEFSNYFGSVFETYVGQILQHCGKSVRLISEKEIRDKYPTEAGKAPDWIVLDGNQAVLIECKATRFSRAALTSGEESAVRDSLKQVLKGLRQLAEFRRECLARTAGLEFLENCTVFKPVLVTLEPFYLINSVLFRDYLDEELRTNGITSLPWQILSVNELEVLQPHLDHGLGIGKVLKDLEDRTFNTVLSELFRDTGLTYKDSFLYKTDQELYRRLGVADRIGGTSGSSIY